MNKPSELTACVQCATEGGERELVRRIDVAGSFPCALAKREATCSVHLIELLPLWCAGRYLRRHARRCQLRSANGDLRAPHTDTTRVICASCCVRSVETCACSKARVAALLDS